MRNAYPSLNWLTRWAAAHSEISWGGPATLRALEPFAARLYSAGATPAAAALATARDYQLSGELSASREAAA